MRTSSRSASSSISFVIYPGRRISGISSVRSRIVDSIPIPTAPPSRISGILPSISAATCAASVGLGLPDVLALGAAIRQPLSSISASATGCPGIRTATVLSPPVVSRGTLSLPGTITVSGPGQNTSASLPARAASPDATAHRSSNREMCTISGLSEGRPLAAYIFDAAEAFRASAPRPYTVSVGNATSSPARIRAAASFITALSIFAGSIGIRLVCM